MTNVISINREVIPSDLMTLRELEAKHGFTYQFLYKHARLGSFPIHYRGVLKASERDVLNFVERKAQKYGRDKQKML